MSDFLKLKRGCRQGDPVSPYVFILCAERLGKMLRTNKNVKGININGNDFLLSHYADDTQIFLDGTEQSLREALSVLDRVYAISGLKINPPRELIKRLDILFFNFLWNLGPDRVKRSIIIKDLSAGGLRMVNINVFIKSLKITWLRRVIQNSKNVSWYTLSGIDVQKIFKFGMGYAKRFKQNLQNPFWKDVLQNWTDFCKDVKIDSINQILDSPYH